MGSAPVKLRYGFDPKGFDELADGSSATSDSAE